MADPTDVINSIGSIATALGFAAAAVGLRSQLQSTHRAYEDEFTRQYAQLRERLSPSFSDSRRETRTLEEVKSEDRAVIRNYLHLASSECAARKMGRVTDSTWKMWRHAIRHELFRSSTDPFYLVFRDVIGRDPKAFSNLQTFLSEEGLESGEAVIPPVTREDKHTEISSRERFDPSQKRRVMRFLAGL